MKKLITILMAALISLGAIAFTGSTGFSADSKPLPAAVCKAIETYVAQIDAARSISEKSKREARYGEAKGALDSVLKQQGKTSLSEMASEYARLTEAVVTADSTSPRLTDDLDKRLKARAALLEMCSDYTTSR